jgi:DNA-binding transcriptional MerR regulator
MYIVFMTRDREPLDSSTLSISQAVDATGLSVKTIRYYEEIGLLPRAPRHNGAARTGGNRLYTGAAIGRLRFVHHARILGMSLQDIRRLVEIAEQGCPRNRPEYRGIIKRHLRHLVRRQRLRFGGRCRVFSCLLGHLWCIYLRRLRFRGLIGSGFIVVSRRGTGYGYGVRVGFLLCG